jgi:DNA-binding transcriptional ArsR family regulator
MASSPASRLLSNATGIERAADLLKALGHPVRLRLVATLSACGERSVTDICAALRLPQALVSQQLGILRLHSLVAVRRTGGFRFYSLAVPQVSELLACMSRCHLVARQARAA